jgi:hypothetical protein
MRFRTLLAVAALAVGAIGLTGAADAAKICKPTITSATVKGHPTRITAEGAAVVVWSAKVARIHTPRFANWQNADNQGFSCSRYTTVIGINAWRCRAMARPCVLN